MFLGIVGLLHWIVEKLLTPTPTQSILSEQKHKLTLAHLHKYLTSWRKFSEILLGANRTIQSLDASNGEYFLNNINRLNLDQLQIEHLLKTQVSLTRLVTKVSNETRQNWR